MLYHEESNSFPHYTLPILLILILMIISVYQEISIQFFNIMILVIAVIYAITSSISYYIKRKQSLHPNTDQKRKPPLSH